MHTYDVEYTDTAGGEANYCWVRRAKIRVPELTAYGYTGSTDGSYRSAVKRQQRVIMRKAKAAVGITGLSGVTTSLGEDFEFRPYGCATVLFVYWSDDNA